MKNGLRITHKSGGNIVSMFVPEETIEQAQLNAKVQRNIDAQRKAATDEQARKAELARQEAAQARQEAAHAERIRKTLRSCMAMAAIGTAAWLAVPLGLAATELAWLVSLPCLCGICFKAGTLK